MRHLKEWVDKDGKEIKLKSTASKVSTPTITKASAARNSLMPSGYFRSRFEKR